MAETAQADIRDSHLIRYVMVTNLRTSKALLVFSVGLFILALTQDGVYTDAADSNATLSASYLFFFGWSAIMAGGGYAWLANPFLISGWVLSITGNGRLGSWFAGVSLLTMLAFRLQTKIITGEEPNYANITGYGLGYWLWIGSAVFILLPNILSLSHKPGGMTKGDSTS